MRLRFLLGLAATVLLACSNGSTAGDAAVDAAAGDTTPEGGPAWDGSPDGIDATVGDAPVPDGGADAGEGGRLVTGFVVDAPRDGGARPAGSNYVLDYPTDAGTSGGTFGAPCTTGNECAALGPHAACFRGPGGGFCTIDCDQDPEGPSQLCPTGTYCFAGLRADGGRLCLPPCTHDTDCAAGPVTTSCGGSLFTFNTADGWSHACMPPCASDADCNVDATGLLCDPTRHRCVLPREVVGSNCGSNADCAALGPAGACMKSVRDPSRGYCTVACDPAAADACILGSVNATQAVGPCVSGYATDASGADVPVCLGACRSDAECQFGSLNTCNYLPGYDAAACTIACSTDADCPGGTCNADRGDCQYPFWSTTCGSDSNCAGGLCVSDFHVGARHNCSLRCTADSECPAGTVCVTSPVADDALGQHIAPGFGGTDVGFCAPSCTLDAGACEDPTTRCLAPMSPTEIDFAGSGSASGPFCWR